MNLITITLAALILIEPIPNHPLEEWHDHWELLPMAPRIPLVTSGNLSHTAGIPAYNSGSDLVKGYSDGFYYGETAGNVDIFRYGTVMVFSDSQGSGGSSRLLGAMARTFPITWRGMMVQASGAPFYITRSSPTQYYFSGQWHRSDTTLLGAGGGSNDLANLGAMWTDNGFTDIDEWMMPFVMINEDSQASDAVMSIAPIDGDDQAEVMYNPETWMSADGVNTIVHMPVLHGGSTSVGAADDFTITTSFWNANSTPAIDSESINITLPSSGTAMHTFGSGNGSALLSMMDSEVFESGPSGSSWRPNTAFESNGDDVSGASIIAGHPWIEIYNDAGTAPITDGFCLPLIVHGSGRNPEMLIPGADNGNAVLLNFGGTPAGRWWMYTNYGDPDTLFYSYGHNSVTRDITAEQGKAESAFQADLFDLIYQHCYDHQQLYGRYPRIRIIIPWGAGSYMDQDRHDEMIGVVDALIAVGIRNTGAIDLFNYWGGESFVDSEAPDDWREATVFALDGAVHPKDTKNARAAWYAMWKIFKGEGNGARNRDRDRVLDRSRR